MPRRKKQRPALPANLSKLEIILLILEVAQHVEWVWDALKAIITLLFS